MTDDMVIRSLDESIAEFNIFSEMELIVLTKCCIAKIQTNETIQTLAKFRACLNRYSETTNHEHDKDVGELIFKIDQYFQNSAREYAH